MAKNTTQTVYIPERLEKYLDEINAKYRSFSEFVQTAIEREFDDNKKKNGK